jgi:hypothetical protein
MDEPLPQEPPLTAEEQAWFAQLLQESSTEDVHLIAAVLGVVSPAHAGMDGSVKVGV